MELGLKPRSAEFAALFVVDDTVFDESRNLNLSYSWSWG